MQLCTLTGWFPRQLDRLLELLDPQHVSSWCFYRN